MLNVARAVTLILLLAWYFYWLIGEWQAEKAKPSHKRTFSLIETASGVIGRTCIGIVFCIQLLGWPFYPFFTSTGVHLIGFLIFLIGFSVSVFARRELAANWTTGLSYQMKKDHQLIKTGVYKYIRHPIYSAASLMCLGVELLVGSYLLVAFFIMLIMAYIQGKKEEKLCLSHFGDEYGSYMRHTKMLIPFVL